MRNLTKTLVAVSLLTSTSVHSLGIGGIKLRSALNEKLNAEIALVTSGAEHVGDVQVKLASPAKFDDAGVPWSYFLTKIKFTPITKADGSVAVKLSSDEALKEPYLDFLVEVTGPNGTLFREFTVLVDPPATYKKPSIPVVASHSAPKPLPNREYDAPEETEALAGHATGEYDPIGSEYGPVQESDTIWSIANQVKPDNVTTEQMVAAIYAKNRNAFAKSNVNTLLAGKMLDIPEGDAILRLAHQSAKARLHSHHVRADAEHTQVSPVTRHKVKPVNPDDAGIKAAKVAKHLKLNPPPEEADTSTPDDGMADAMQANNRHIQNTLADRNTDDADLKQRFEKIEQQLQMMQKMLELKDAQLAKLQNDGNTVVTPPVAEPKPAESIKTESVVAPLINPLDAKAPTVAPNAAQAPLATAPVIAPASAPAVKAPEVKRVGMNPAPPVNSDAAIVEQFMDYYLLAGGIGAGLLGALGLIWWRKRKVEKTIDTESMFASASQISLPDTEKEGTSKFEQTSGYEVGTVGDSSFLSEFTPSEFDAFETDQTEIDPLSEADVYLAYGRYQQAEELIRQVIAEYPNRHDCKLKLLEIFHTSENKQAFGQYMQQLEADGMKLDKGFWSKVLDMSNDFESGAAAISMSNGLQAGYGATAVFKPEVDEFDLGELVDEPVVTQQSTKPEQNEVKPAPVSSGASTKIKDIPEESYKPASFADNDFGSEDRHTDFDFDQYATEFFSTTKETGAVEEVIDDGGLAFNLSDFSDQPMAAKDELIELTEENDDNGLDFDLSAFAAEKAESDRETIEFLEEDDDNSLEFNLEAFNSSLKQSTPNKSVATSQANSLDFDLDAGRGQTAQQQDVADDFEFDFDFNLLADNNALDTGDRAFDRLEVADLADQENVFETKVNLANAYVDMGDLDAAKDIANDLLQGTAEQKKVGQQILEKIS